MPSRKITTRIYSIVLLALCTGITTAAATGKLEALDESVPQRGFRLEKRNVADLPPLADPDAQFYYRDQKALRHAIAEDEEPQDLSVTIADDFDDRLSSLTIIYPSLPSILGPVAALSYIHLLYLTSVSRWYLVETLQLLAFACFPTLPIIQLLSNTYKTTLAAFRARNARGPRGNTSAASLPSLSYTLAGLGGMYAFRGSESFTSFSLRRRRVSEYPAAALQAQVAQPVLSIAFPLELVLIMLELAAGGLGLVLGLNVPRRSDWDLVSVGIDQRSWWTALGGFIASSLCLVLHLANRAFVVGGQPVPGSAGADAEAAVGSDAASDAHWSEKSSSHTRNASGPLHALPAAPGLEGVGGSLLWESNVLSEIVVSALLQDMAVAWAGGSYTLVGLLSVFLANRMVLAVIFILGLVFNRVIRRYATLRSSASLEGLVLDNKQLARKRRWEALLRPLFVVFGCAVCGGIILLQIVTALEENTVGNIPV